MTVAELIEALQREPQHLPVYIERVEPGIRWRPAMIDAVRLEGPHVLVITEEKWTLG